MRRREFLGGLGGLLVTGGAHSRAHTAKSVQPASPPPHAYDFIVVGAGSSGCALAARLSAQQDVRVLVLEAGGPQRDDPAIVTPGRWVSLIGSALDWGYATEPEPALQGRRIVFPRGKVVGGSSAVNAMTYLRGHRRDFDRWSEVGSGGWSYDQLLPVFKRIEHNSRGASAYRGADGPLFVSDGLDPHAGHEAFLRAAQSLGYAADPQWDFSVPAPDNAAGYYQKNIKDGLRHSAAAAFLEPAMARKNLAIVTGAQATRLIVERRRVTAVEYLRNGSLTQVRAQRAVILSGGVVESPRLLMLSGIGPADHLKSLGIPVVADLPGVGANLQDHLKLSLRWNGKTTLPPSTVTAGMFVHSSRGTANGSAPPDLQFYVGRGVDQPDRFVTITVSLVRPRSRGEVRLRSADPLAPPMIRARYLQEQADVDALVRGAQLARELGTSAAYDTLRGDEAEPGSSVTSVGELADFARRATDTIYHPAGTCRMGRDNEAVVDARLRLRGVQGLYVADASIMPDVVCAPTHAACVMIGDRAAEMLLSD